MTDAAESVCGELLEQRVLGGRVKAGCRPLTEAAHPVIARFAMSTTGW
jgi:hypothetical protein